jgi:hypothetical protein
MAQEKLMAVFCGTVPLKDFVEKEFHGLRLLKNIILNAL